MAATGMVKKNFSLFDMTAEEIEIIHLSLRDYQEKVRKEQLDTDKGIQWFNVVSNLVEVVNHIRGE